MSAGMPRISRDSHALAMRAIDNDPFLAEALGLVDYDGHNANGIAGSRPKPARREVTIVSPEEEARALLGQGEIGRPFNPGPNAAATAGAA